jgi:hypothetical protein
VVAGAVGGALLALAPAGAVAPAAAEDGSDLVEACEPLTAVPEAGPRACKSVEAGTWLAAQSCRRVDGLQEPMCPTVDGRPVHEAAVREVETGWLGRALALQRQLDLDVPLSQALFPHTHNSANSAAYAPSISSLDANQVLTLTDQLRLGMRAIEIDVHWTPNPSGDPAHGMRAAVQCHGEPVATPAGVLHAGCSVDTLLVDLLREVRTWLDQPANQGEVVLLYLENALDDDEAAHEAAVAAIDATLGGLVARPTEGGGCQSLPVERSKQQLLDAGTPVLITGNCGPGGWNDRVFDRYPSWDEAGGSTFDCAAERDEIEFGSILVRRYEDSTWLSAMAGSGSHRDAPTISEMVRCGVNLVGFDQLHPGDDRLPGLVWSWRTDEPSASAVDQCAALGTDGRFFGDDCGVPRPVACRTADGGWAVTADAATWSAGEDACRSAGHAGAGVPSNGWDSGLLRAAAVEADAGEVWLAYGQDDTGAWVTGIPASEPAPAPVDAPGRSEDRLGDPAGHGGPPTEPGVGRGKPIAVHNPVPGLPVLVTATVCLAMAATAARRRSITR